MITVLIVSTWDLTTFEDRWSSSTGGSSDCINLRFGQLRGLSIDAQPVIAHCINLRPGHLRRLARSSPGILTDCINLGFGHFRGLLLRTPRRRADCINLRFGHRRGLDMRARLDHENCINLGSEFLRRSCGNTLSRLLYCINRGPDTFEDTSASE